MSVYQLFTCSGNKFTIGERSKVLKNIVVLLLPWNTISNVMFTGQSCAFEHRLKKQIITNCQADWHLPKPNIRNTKICKGTRLLVTLLLTITIYSRIQNIQKKKKTFACWSYMHSGLLIWFLHNTFVSFLCAPCSGMF